MPFVHLEFKFLPFYIKTSRSNVIGTTLLSYETFLVALLNIGQKPITGAVFELGHGVGVVRDNTRLTLLNTLCNYLAIFDKVKLILLIKVLTRIQLLTLSDSTHRIVVYLNLFLIEFASTEGGFLHVIANLSEGTEVWDRRRRQTDSSTRGRLGSVGKTAILCKWIYASSFEPFKLGAGVVIGVLGIELLLPIIHFQLTLHLHKFLLALVLFFSTDCTENATEERTSSTTSTAGEKITNIHN